MATKKQKRLAGEAKQQANREESTRLGLLAQRKDQERRAAKKQAEIDAVKAEKRKKSAKQAINAMAPVGVS